MLLNSISRDLNNGFKEAPFTKREVCSQCNSIFVIQNGKFSGREKQICKFCE